MLALFSQTCSVQLLWNSRFLNPLQLRLITRVAVCIITKFQSVKCSFGFAVWRKSQSPAPVFSFTTVANQDSENSATE